MLQPSESPPSSSTEESALPTQKNATPRENNNSSEHKDDLRWAQRILAGDRKAFAELYDTCAPALLRRLTRITGSLDHAEDCLQQVFTEALRTLPQYRGQGRLEAWLERIATYTAMGWFRKKYRWRDLMEQITEVFTPESVEPTPLPLPEELFFQEEMKAVVWQLLDRLSPRKRMVLVLCDLEGHTLEEAAKQMDIPVGTAASRLFHARQDFQKAAIAEFRRQGLEIGDWLASSKK